MKAKLVGFMALMMASTLSLAVDGSAPDSQSIIDKEEWGIRNGCIANMNIKRVHFISNTTGLIELSGDRKVKVTLRNRCTGIRTEGYVHKPINNRFCEGDMLRVINYGHTCVVDTLEPYITLEGEASKKEAAAKVGGEAGK